MPRRSTGVPQKQVPDAGSVHLWDITRAADACASTSCTNPATGPRATAGSWGGWDLNPRSSGYEPAALTSLATAPDRAYRAVVPAPGGATIVEWMSRDGSSWALRWPSRLRSSRPAPRSRGICVVGDSAVRPAHSAVSGAGSTRCGGRPPRMRTPIGRPRSRFRHRLRSPAIRAASSATASCSTANLVETARRLSARRPYRAPADRATPSPPPRSPGPTPCADARHPRPHCRARSAARDCR